MTAFSINFADQFFGMQSALLSAQLAETSRSADHLTLNNAMAFSLVAGAQDSSNQYFYGLAAQQTAYINALGQKYAAVTEINARNAGKSGGWFSKIFG